MDRFRDRVTESVKFSAKGDENFGSYAVKFVFRL